ncbi:hypothetical protein DTO027B5_6852 [Paecilomyces variotii]|nr:hypothetical protein DTO021C3_4936 [Paecilomyces variotii]KAJ9331394.1 hypothetical protein DTO027B5_6852 [Paecilomyces variotii]
MLIYLHTSLTRSSSRFTHPSPTIKSTSTRCSRERTPHIAHTYGKGPGYSLLSFSSKTDIYVKKKKRKKLP